MKQSLSQPRNRSLTANKATSTPKPSLAIIDAMALTVGIVVGAGIFKTPSLVAANASSEAGVMLVWLAGGVISLAGALCYAELATTYPNAGGDYHYLGRAFGKDLAFLFAWARMTIIQTGSIALLAFVFGDYASQLLQLDGAYSPGIYAALLVVVLTGINVAGIQQGKWTQNLLTLVEVCGVLLVIVAGLVLASSASVPPLAAAVSSNGDAAAAATPPTAFGLAMVFVLLTYGGWNEAAYISAEVYGAQQKRTMARALVWSILLITALYLLINLAYMRGLGLAAMRRSDVVAADLMRAAIGQRGAQVISLLITVSAITSANATVLTGGRSNYALGRDFPLFGWLGRWRGEGGANTPRNALLVQGAIALALVALGARTREGFATMVDYTAPIFWVFFLLTGISLFVLRVREPNVARPFRVPLYPLTPALFCVAALYVLQSSVAYVADKGIGALVGVAVLIAGVPLLLLARLRRS